MQTTQIDRVPRRRSPWKVAAVGLLPVALAVVLAGCTPDPEPATSSAPAAVPTASAAPTTDPAATGLAFNPTGTAADNKAFFDAVNQGLIGGNPAADGVAITTNLRANGFDTAAMQVTPDVTTVGVAADSVQFSVKMGNDCLIGQYGHGQYSSLVAPALGTGACLVGQTRAIDW